MDGTIVNSTDNTYPPSGNGVGAGSGKRSLPDQGSNNEEELNRFVTDDAPRAARIPAADKGLIVCIYRIPHTCADIRLSNLFERTSGSMRDRAGIDADVWFRMQPSYAQDLGAGSVTVSLTLAVLQSWV